MIFDRVSHTIMTFMVVEAFVANVYTLLWAVILCKNFPICVPQLIILTQVTNLLKISTRCNSSCFGVSWFIILAFTGNSTGATTGLLVITLIIIILIWSLMLIRLLFISYLRLLGLKFVSLNRLNLRLTLIITLKNLKFDILILRVLGS